ncbi:hypothetical protein [Phyllobacterium lublinensis]|uniref:hypothetical protein n=1 Tax=Phyllobacterium lublinensis TaxID=2875708 RepID=UPI001CCB370D|nr:hypothetical protein [Phyllobacterium sp. 2063]MBZ9653566.1 hypothetical protein [Phyllobacterium sp. 2063]
MNVLFFFAVMFAIVLAVIVDPAFAQDLTEAPPAWFNEIWVILQPVIVMLVSTVGPILITWLAAKLAFLLQSTDEAKRNEIEERLRVALHTSAFNALKYAASRSGIQLPDMLSSASPAVLSAIDYIRSKNPDAVDAFKLSNEQLAEIVISKLPDVKAIIAAGQPADAKQ